MEEQLMEEGKAKTTGKRVALPPHIEQRIQAAKVRLMERRVVKSGPEAGSIYQHVTTEVNNTAPRSMDIIVRKGWDGPVMTPEKVREEARQRLRVACLGALKVQELQPSAPVTVGMTRKGETLIITGPKTTNGPEGGL